MMKAPIRVQPYRRFMVREMDGGPVRIPPAVQLYDTQQIEKNQGEI